MDCETFALRKKFLEKFYKDRVKEEVKNKLKNLFYTNNHSSYYSMNVIHI